MSNYIIHKMVNVQSQNLLFDIKNMVNNVAS